MDYRMVVPGTLPQAADLWDYCFEKKDDPFFQWYFNEYCTKDNFVLGGFDPLENRLVNMLHLNPYHVRVRGKDWTIPYIVGVATAPEARGRNLTAGLLERAFQLQQLQKRPFVLLMPVYAGIYQPFQFGFCYEKHVYDMPLASLKVPKVPVTVDLRRFPDIRPEALAAAQVKTLLIEETGDTLDRHVLPEPEDLKQTVVTGNGLDAIRSIYDRFGETHNGMPVRNDFQWRKLLTVNAMDGLQAAVSYKDGEPLAYMFYKIDGEGTFLVHELLSVTAEGKHALLRYAATHVATAKRFYWEAPEDDRTYLNFPDASLSGSCRPFMMARCIDAELALAEYPVPEGMPDGTCAVIVNDRMMNLNSHLFRLTVKDGVLTVTRSDETEDAVLDIDVFTQLYFGAYTASGLHAAGKLTVRSKEALDFLDRLFPRCSNYINEYF